MFVEVDQLCWLTNKCTRGITVARYNTAMWPPLHHDWPWPFAIHWAIDAH